MCSVIVEKGMYNWSYCLKCFSSWENICNFYSLSYSIALVGVFNDPSQATTILCNIVAWIIESKQFYSPSTLCDCLLACACPHVLWTAQLFSKEASLWYSRCTVSMISCMVYIYNQATAALMAFGCHNLWCQWYIKCKIIIRM